MLDGCQGVDGALPVTADSTDTIVAEPRFLVLHFVGGKNSHHTSAQVTSLQKLLMGMHIARES